MTNISRIESNKLNTIKNTRTLSKKPDKIDINTDNISSVYDKNGLSQAVSAKYLSSVNFGSKLNTTDFSKLVSELKLTNLDPGNIESKISLLFKNPGFHKLNAIDQKICAAAAVIGKDRSLTKEVSSFINDKRALSRLNGILDNSNLINTLNKRANHEVPLSLKDFRDFHIVKDYAVKFRRTGDLDIARVLMESGLYGDYNPKLHDESIKVLDDFINQIHQNGIWIPQTDIPAASKIKKAATTIGSEDNVTQNVIIDFATDDLEKLGFQKGVTKESFTAIGHAVDEDRFNPGLLDYVTEDNTEALLSTTFYKGDKFPTFAERKYGFFMDVDPDNISLASDHNMCSGFSKDFIDFKNGLLFAQKKERNQFAKNFCQKMHIEQENYPEIYHNIVKVRSLDDIQDPKVKNALNNTINEVIVNKDGDINEIVCYSPKLMAMFSKAKNIEDIPYKLRKYAQDHDIPIIDISKLN